MTENRGVQPARELRNMWQGLKWRVTGERDSMKNSPVTDSIQVEGFGMEQEGRRPSSLIASLYLPPTVEKAGEKLSVMLLWYQVPAEALELIARLYDLADTTSRAQGERLQELLVSCSSSTKSPMSLLEEEVEDQH